MKKYLIVAFSLIVGITYISYAGDRVVSAPKTQTGWPVNPTYGGVDYTTYAFSSSGRLVFTGEGVPTHMVVSSVPAGGLVGPAFVMFRDTAAVTGTTDTETSNEVYRIHLATVNASDSTTTRGFGVNNDPALGYIYELPPFKFRRGCVAKINVSSYNVTFGYNAFAAQAGKDKQ